MLIEVAEQEVLKGDLLLVREELLRVREITVIVYAISIYHCKIVSKSFNKDCTIINIKCALHQ